MPRVVRWFVCAAWLWAAALASAHANASPADELGFSDVYRYHGVPMFWIEPETGRIIDANDAAARLYGHSIATLRQQRIQDISLLTEYQAAQEHAASQGRNGFFFPHPLSSGEVRPVAVYSAPYRVGDRWLQLSFVLDLSTHSATEFERWRSDTQMHTALAQQRDASARAHRSELLVSATVLVAGFLLLAAAAWHLHRRTRQAEPLRQAADAAQRREQASQLSSVATAHGVQAIMHGADMASWDWDLQHDRLHLDAHAWRMLGRSATADQSLGMAQWTALIAPSDRSTFEQAWARHLAGQHPALECELRLRHPDGHLVPILLRGRVVARAQDGTPTRLAGVMGDASQWRQAQEAAALAELVFRHTHEAVLITDAQQRIVRVNEAFGRLTGYTPDEVIGRTPSLLASGRHEPTFFAQLQRDLHAQGYWSGEIWNRRRDGSLMVNWISISAVPDAQGGWQGYVGVFHDITQRKLSEAELQRTALTDALTGLGNRVMLHDRLQQALARATRHGSTLAVVMLDLDGFKAINDTHGHAAGDRLLVALAQRLRALAREVDTVVRLGGDEFVLLLPDLARPQDAEPIVQRILQAMAQPVDDAVGALQVSASVGVSFYPQDAGVDADALLQQADHAMYVAKRGGRNRYAYWDPAWASSGNTSEAGSAGANNQP
ncbi:MAG: diguanylate cyclase domain-containing protein [Tepidimonas sp.]|uniref:diguanylate cyclase domain-containing protein n=1 Tax=Tepidimonas sp. TaxID=2002775 RepID=UPI004054D953